MQPIMVAPTPETSTRLTHLFHNILSYDTNIMLAAIISLFVVILFVLLLHVYARWFLVQARQGSRRSVSVPQVIGNRFHQFHSFTVDTRNFADSPTNQGLESSVISSIPLFMYKANDHNDDLDCTVCLSVFEDEEVGRKLPKCSHAFHVECIDMWLHSHSTCPICRSPVLWDSKIADTNSKDGVHTEEVSEATLDEAEISNQTSALMEIIVEVPNPENERTISNTNDSVSVPSPAQIVGDSIKRIMSRNRSERMVHPFTSL